MIAKVQNVGSLPFLFPCFLLFSGRLPSCAMFRKKSLVDLFIWKKFNVLLIRVARQDELNMYGACGKRTFEEVR